MGPKKWVKFGHSLLARPTKAPLHLSLHIFKYLLEKCQSYCHVFPMPRQRRTEDKSQRITQMQIVKILWFLDQRAFLHRRSSFWRHYPSLWFLDQHAFLHLRSSFRRHYQSLLRCWGYKVHATRSFVNFLEPRLSCFECFCGAAAAVGARLTCINVFQ